MNFSLKTLFVLTLTAATLCANYLTYKHAEEQTTKKYICFQVKFENYLKARPVPPGSNHSALQDQLDPSEYNEIKTYDGWLTISYSQPHKYNIDLPPTWLCHYLSFEPPEEAVAVARWELKSIYGIEEIPDANGFMGIRNRYGQEAQDYSYYARFPEEPMWYREMPK